MSASVELEVEELEVGLHPRGRDRLRENNVAALDVPAQHDLCRRFAVGVGDSHDDRIIENFALSDRRPRLGGDSVLSPVCADRFICEIGVDLDLVDCRDGGGFLREPVEVRRLEVRHSDAAGPSV